MLLLSSFCGLVYTSIYSVYNFVVVGLGSVISSVREGVFSGMGRTFYSNFERFKTTFDKFETIYFGLVFYLYSIAILVYKPFIEVYTAKMDADYKSAIYPLIFILMKLVVNLRIPSIITTNIAGHFKQVKMYAVTEAIINLAISLALVWKLNIIGVAIGTLVGAAYRTPLLVNYANKNILKIRNTNIIKKVAVFAIPFTVCTVVSFILELHADSFLKWFEISVVAAVCVSAAFTLIFLIFYRKLVNAAFANFKKLIKRKAN